MEVLIRADGADVLLLAVMTEITTGVKEVFLDDSV